MIVKIEALRGLTAEKWEWDENATRGREMPPHQDKVSASKG